MNIIFTFIRCLRSNFVIIYIFFENWSLGQPLFWRLSVSWIITSQVVGNENNMISKSEVTESFPIYVNAFGLPLPEFKSAL